MQDDEKRAAAGAAVGEIRDGMLVGIGTGTTAAHAIRALGARVRGGLTIRAVATSLESEAAARAEGIAVEDFARVARLDLTIDGADQIDRRLFAVKGAGGAMLREKTVAAASARMVVIADSTKLVGAIDGRRVPVEVLAFARASVVAHLEALGAVVRVRRTGDGDAYRTDGGNLIADCAFAVMDDPVALSAAIDAVPGALGHGLFLREVDAAYVAHDGVVTKLERSDGRG